MISVRNLSKIYKIGKGRKAKSVVALNNISIDFPDKGLVFLLGKSGSGKSTLLNSIGGLDTFDSGEIIIKGKSSKDFKQQDFDSYRNTFIGFIFQEYNILEEFSVGKNLSIALELQGKPVKKDIVNNLLEQVDLAGYYRRKPNQLSGGQKQRVAIARALIKDPEIIMADEPTGALDSTTGKQVFDTLKKLSETKLVIVVSHDREFAEIYGDRIIELKDGCIIRDDTKTEVEAVKTNSGVSFIDDKIVHIKKGQQLTNEDLTKIGMMLVKNTKEEDVFISFDSKTNQEVKKTAFITDEGNREVFIKTEADHIERKEHNPNDFKMIKSKLKFKDAFKMGASSLKHKTIRLIFTILLSVVAFAMFGMVDTMTAFNASDSAYQTITQLDIKTLSVKKGSKDGYDYMYYSYPITKDDVQNIKNNNKNYSFYEVTYGNTYFSLRGVNNSSNNDKAIYSNNAISGIMGIDDTIEKELGVKLIEGVYPEAENEICISKHTYEAIINSTDCKDFETLKTKEMDIYLSHDWESFKVVGIVENDTDLSRYEDLRSDNASRMENYMKFSEMEIMLGYGLANMCYVSPDVYESFYKVRDMGSDYINYTAYLPGQSYHGGYSESYYKLSSLSETPTYIKPGYDVATLTSKQAIVSLGLLTENLYIPSDEVKSKIDNGLKVSVSRGYPANDSNKAFEIEVVGYIDDNGADIYLSNDHYNKYFVGTDYLLTRLKQNSSDQQLIENIYGENSTFIALTPATPALSSIGSFINGSKEPFLYIGIGLAVFAALMLMNFISTSISYKKKEIGVLRAIGARSKDVFSIFFLESLVICLINFVLSVISCGIVCFFVSKSFIEGLGISLYLLNFGIRQIILMAGLSLVIAFISTFLPVYKFAKKNPIDSINDR